MEKDQKELQAQIQPTSISKRVFSPWYYNRYFRYAIGTILFLLIIFLINQIAFLIAPIFNFISTLFAPIIISFLFYYLFRPIVYFLEKWNVPRIVSIITIYIIVAIILILFFAYLGPILATQVTSIADAIVNGLKSLEGAPKSLEIGPFNLNLEYEIKERLVAFLQQIVTTVSKNVVDLLAIVTRVATILVVIPFILFYLLKEDQDFSSKFLHSVPEDFGKEVRKILKNVDTTLSNYINGLVIVAVSIGGLLFISYLLIGLDYALILSFIALIFTTIPFLGPFLAITPALLVGWSQSPFMALKVAIAFIIVQQTESNIISPQIIGQRLHIHPLTIILLLLAAGTLYGLVGLILATPLYAVSKVLIENFYKIYQLRYPKIKAQMAKLE